MCIVSQEHEFRAECEAAFDLLMRRYGDRFTPEMADGNITRRQVSRMYRSYQRVLALIF
jgi:hypothetical protein